MSGDLNSRGVKRKLSTEIDCDQVESSVTENECRRQRMDLGLSSLCVIPPSLLPKEDHEAGTESEVNNLPVGRVKSTAYYSPDSLSSQSMSDDEDGDGSEDEEDEEEDGEEEDESEFVEDESLESDPMDESRQASGESESGYDERASSNSSLSDSATSESDFPPITVPPAESTLLSGNPASSSCVSLPSAPHLTASPSHSPLPSSSSPSPSSFTCPTTASVTSSTNPIGGLSDGLSGSSFCAYSMAPAGVSRSSSSAYVQSRAHTTNLRKDNSQYMRQRQQIFNLSLCKLSRFRQSSDPSLLRSVLICNTLRMLEKELEREGFKINFGPNGVSFISPVPTPPDLDFMPPVFQPGPPPPPPPSTSFDCTPVPEQSAPYPVAPSTLSEPYTSYGTPCDSNGDSCSDYDKYFAMDSSSPSGRATPFMKNYSSNEYTGRSNEPSLNSAFCYGDEQTPDRLSSLNWSNMLTFNNSPSASAPASEVPSSSNRHLSQSSPEVLPSLLPYAVEQSEVQVAPMLNSCPSSAAILTSSCASLSPSSSSTTFATLLPPTSTPSSSAPLMGPNSMLVSSAQNSISSDTSYMMAASTTGSTYYSSSSLSSQYSSSPQSPSAPQTCGTNASPSSPACTLGMMSTSSYMNSYLSYSGSSDEIFGDIDLSLYDFDIFSPLSPPSVSNKSGPIMSAEELIRNINSAEVNSGSGSGACANPSALLSISHYSVNAFSGQSYTSSSYCTSSSSSMTNVVSSISTSSSAINSQLMMSQTISSMSSSTPTNCGSSSAAGTSLHLHTSSGRYYKASEERDQQTVTTIKCHN